MKAIEKKAENGNFKSNRKCKRVLRVFISPLFSLLLLIFSTNVSFAHCDTMDGPLIKDAKMAINTGNVNYVLIWVQPAYETEIKEAFSLTMKVRKLGPDAENLAERYFYETIVRLHRSGEGVPYTGVKPSGTPVDNRILAADKSIESGNLSPLKDLVPKEKLPELESRFNKVMALRNYDVNDVSKGREYIEAYVQFFKFAEGEEDDHLSHELHNQ